VNDVGGAADGAGSDATAAQLVVDEIRSLGGEAVANTDSVSSWEGSQRLVQTALDAFGDLHVLVNNAGILRDRMLVNMEESDWDAVADVHLKGTFCTTRHAATYWREKSKRSEVVSASVVCTSSNSGLQNNVGQANYGAAKAGIAAFAQIAAKELARYDVRVNTIAPVARTRLTMATPGLDALVKQPDDPTAFDVFDPANISPLVAFLGTADCPYTGGVWGVWGGDIGVYEGWRVTGQVSKQGRWEVEELALEIPLMLGGRVGSPELLLSEGQTGAELMQEAFAD
jgi:NAD(P)-dependent dehydrogenase (short-subunit alcohol dehydrogenase family)